MIVYHGSIVAIRKPLLLSGRTRVDFGRGFYVTEIVDQAQEWAKQKAFILGKPAVVSGYHLMVEHLMVKEFSRASEEWVDFVIENRTGKAKRHEYDIIVGEMADDKVYDSIDLYLRDYISREELLRRIRITKRNQQICIATEKAINNLTFIREYCI